MQEFKLSLSNLSKMYELHTQGESGVLAYMKENDLTFEKMDRKEMYFFRAFAEMGFAGVLKEMSARGADFKNLKVDEKTSFETVLDNYLERAKIYNPNSLNVILSAGNYSPDELAEAYIKVCKLHQESIENNDNLIECKNLDVLTGVFLNKGMKFSCLTKNGVVPFYALCELYDAATLTKGFQAPESYEKMLDSCVQKGLNADVDLNVVDKNGHTGFMFKHKGLKSKFVRFQYLKDDERLLDLFLIVDQLVKGSVEPQLVTKMQKHIKQIQSDIQNGKKRFYM